MSITIDGTTGISGNNGSAGTPAIQGEDTNTGIFFPAADTVGVATAGTERVRVDSSGNVGIGINNPLSPLHVYYTNASTYGDGTAAPDVTSLLSIQNGSQVDGTYGGIRLVSESAVGTSGVWTIASVSTSSNYDNHLVFHTRTGLATYAERMRIDSSGNVGIGTASPTAVLDVVGSAAFSTTGATQITLSDSDGGFAASKINVENGGRDFRIAAPQDIIFETGTIDRARFDPSGTLLIGKSSSSISTPGFEFPVSGAGYITADNNAPLILNRETADGQLVQFRQDNVQEGNINVSGTTVSYVGGHLSRWAQFPDNSRPELFKGTVMSNLDQMSQWGEEDNEQLNCVQVSTVEGDANVAGVFVDWDGTDDDYNDILLAMTGDMVIRIGAGVTVARGDLLMSAGDGTAKPQGDDIVRSKTIAKVTSTHVSHTYADGSYAVPCVLMAC